VGGAPHHPPRMGRRSLATVTDAVTVPSTLLLSLRYTRADDDSRPGCGCCGAGAGDCHMQWYSQGGRLFEHGRPGLDARVSRSLLWEYCPDGPPGGPSVAHSAFPVGRDDEASRWWGTSWGCSTCLVTRPQYTYRPRCRPRDVRALPLQYLPLPAAHAFCRNKNHLARRTASLPPLLSSVSLFPKGC